MFTRHVSAKLSAYLNGELASEEARRLREHLLACKRCRAEYEEVKLGVQLAESLPEVAAPLTLWAEIETLLDAQAVQNQSESARLPRRLTVTFTWQKAVATVALLVICAVVVVVFYKRLHPQTWEVIILEGKPKINSSAMKDEDKIAEGGLLETDGTSRAKINVSSIGEVEVDPNTRVKLVSTRLTDQRLAMERGRLRARISAPPRIFFVDTPSAQVADLGCAYTLEVDDAGRSTLHVSSGWVAFDLNGHEVKVPTGASCETRPNLGVGTPFFTDATRAFKDALTTIDFGGGGPAAVNILLNESRPRDTLTLFNLLYRVDNQERPGVYDKLASYVAPPEGVTRDGVLAMNPQMLDAYRATLEQVWVQETFPALRNVLRGLTEQKQTKH